MMKKKFFTFVSILLALTAASPVSAQETRVVDVVPGSKGMLPAMPELPQLEGKRVAGLLLKQVRYWNGGWAFQYYEAELYLPSFTEEEAEYCTLQSRTKSSGEWVTALDGEGNAAHYSSAADLTPRLKEDTDYRVVLHNGTKDGYVSNEVSATYPTVHYSFITKSQWFYADPLFIGGTITGSRVEAQRMDGEWNRDAQRYDFTFAEQCNTDNTNYYRRQWYRMNPNTYEMTPIEGATGKDYVATAEDLGYNIMEVIRGDNIHISYYILFGHEQVKTCIRASLEYLGPDGFILNTDYALPDGGKDLRIIGNSRSEDGFNGEVARDKIREIKPGQYAVYTPVDENMYYMGAYEVDDIWDDTSDYILRFDRGTPEQSWLRPVQIYCMMYYNQPIVINASVNTPIDIIGRNIDNQWSVVANYDTSGVAEGDYFRMVWGKYCLKARGTATTLPTYYPDKLMWYEATSATPGTDGYDEQYNPITNTYYIQAVAKPAPLTGSGTISGSIRPQTTTRADNSVSGQTVYLKGKDGNVVAYTETDANGAFRFQNVPEGSYTVLINIEGLTMERPAQVTLTAANPNATGVDYALDGSVIKNVNAVVMPGDVNGDFVVDVADIATVISVMAKGTGPQSGTAPNPADVNGDGVVDVADIATIISIMAKN